MGESMLGESISIRRGGVSGCICIGSDGWIVCHCQGIVGVVGGPIASRSRYCLRGRGLHSGVAVLGPAEERFWQVLRRGGRGVSRWAEGAFTRRQCRRTLRGRAVATPVARVAVGAVVPGIPAFADSPDVSTALPFLVQLQHHGSDSLWRQRSWGLLEATESVEE